MVCVHAIQTCIKTVSFRSAVVTMLQQLQGLGSWGLDDIEASAAASVSWFE